MSDVIHLLGYLIAALMAVIALVCWRKAASFHVLLVESAGRIDAMKGHLAQVEKDRNKLLDRSDQSKETIHKLEKQNATQKHKIDTELKRAEERAATAEEQKQTLELRVDHFKSQVEALTRQLKESDADSKELQTKMAYAAAETEKRLRTARDPVSKELEETKHRARQNEMKLRQVELELENFKKNAGALDEEKFKDLERRASHFERLYKSMRGLREMADERNKNWEVALRKLAVWIVARGKTRLDVQHAALGPIVGEALEMIGERLVEDDFHVDSANDVNLAVEPSATVASE